MTRDKFVKVVTAAVSAVVSGNTELLADDLEKIQEAVEAVIAKEAISPEWATITLMAKNDVVSMERT